MPDLKEVASEHWEIAPRATSFVPRAVFLPGQLERIRGTQFSTIEEVLRDFRGEFEATHDPVVGFRIKHVNLVDGVLYGQRALRYLREPQRRRFAYLVPEERMSGALYESWNGNRWFGSWLTQDCLTYRLAEQFGAPFTTRMRTTPHEAEYEARLDMRPKRVAHVHFDELVFFHDISHSEHLIGRGIDMRRRLLAGESYDTHPGVFLFRGTSGDRRVLTNEPAIAENFAKRHGFRVLDALNTPLPEILRACAGAQVVAGVEGSQLAHGLVVMPPGSALLVIQPPYRTTSVLKSVTDRQAQRFAFVVGSGRTEEFTVDWDDVDATLDLLASSASSH